MIVMIVMISYGAKRKKEKKSWKSKHSFFLFFSFDLVAPSRVFSFCSLRLLYFFNAEAAKIPQRAQSGQDPGGGIKWQLCILAGNDPHARTQRNKESW